MKCGTPRGDLISTEASLQAPSFAPVMDGPEAAPVWEMGGKPVPAETVQDGGPHVGAPDNHRLRMTSQAGHLGARTRRRLATSYHSGGGSLTRVLSTRPPFWGA